MDSVKDHRWLEAAERALRPNRSSHVRRLLRGLALALSMVLLFLGFALGETAEGPVSVSTPDGASGAEAPVELPVVVPLEVSERVGYWVDRFSTEERSGFETLLAREGVYAPMIRAKLREHGMPEELVYLAMIESGFTADARSQAAATGMWQFMPATARAYGLRVDAYVDERRDPIAATDAALDYLDRLYERYGSWYLAAAAYNAGPSRVSRELRRHASAREGDEALYWEIVDHLPRETANYIPRLLAATALARTSESFGFDVERESPYRFDIVWVPGGTSLEGLAAELGIEAEVLQTLNPHLIRGVTPPERVYGLRVPVGAAGAVVAALGPTHRAD